MPEEDLDDEYLEVEFCIICDTTIDYEAYVLIIEAIRRIDPNITKIIHVGGTNIVDISGRWNEFEVEKRSKKIYEISGVKKVIIQKKNKVFVRRVSEYVPISDHVEWRMNKDVVAKITRAISDRDYNTAFTESCSYIEHVGKKLLDISKKERLEIIIDSLYSTNLINQMIHGEMHRVRKLRNKFEHEGRSFEYSSEQAQEAENMVTKALRCVKYLEAKYESIKTSFVFNLSH